MTSQQQADEWLAIWRDLRAHGLSPAEREAIINAEIERYYEARFFRALQGIRSVVSSPRV